jgi:DNA replication protein DnaC
MTTTSLIRQHLTTLGLKAMAKVLDEELARAMREQSPVTEVLERLLGIEAQQRLDRRIERRIKMAKLPDRKLLTDFDFDFQTGVDRAQIMELAKLDFVRRRQSLIIAGNSGTGKSHLAKALLLLACGHGFRCRYTTATDMLTTLLAARADQSLPEKLKLYTSPDLLLIDEVGFDRIEQEEARPAGLFCKVIEKRYGKASTILTTNIDFEQLGDYLGDPVLTTAIVDRLIHHAVILTVKGPSWRMHESKRLNAEMATLGQSPKGTAAAGSDRGKPRSTNHREPRKEN